MKVVVIGGPPLVFSKHLANAFKEEGHKTKHINYRLLNMHKMNMTNKWLNNSIIRRCEDFKPDMVIVVKGETIPASTIETIKQRTKAKMISWVLDDPVGKYYPSGKLTNLAAFDHIFVFDSHYIPLVQEMCGHKNVDYLPISAGDEYEEIVLLDKRSYDFSGCFIGTYWPDREQLLMLLKDKNIVIIGPGWEKLAKDHPLKPKIKNRDIQGADVARWFNRSKIIINLTHEQAVDDGINLRIPEALVGKNFLLTNTLPGLSKLFTPGFDLETYSTPEEFVEKFNFYVSHDEERKKIAQQGYETFQHDHTMRERVKQMMGIIGK